MTLADLCNRFLDDPTSGRTRKSASVYRTTYAAFLELIGSEVPVASITRATCRDTLSVLQHLPPNARKRWPTLTLTEVSIKARAEGIAPMSPANTNEYMSKLATLLNWAVKEELILRNPAKGLRIVDTVSRRDKRLPFSSSQLQSIFDAPLYRGCRDDGYGFATPGSAKPRRSRFWIPLIGLWTGMRLNEICQLHLSDIREIDRISCFVVSVGNAEDKSLKTSSSERVVPIHPILVRIGFLEYVEALRRDGGSTRVFPELSQDTFGHYSGKFSKWFARFVATCGAASDRTCFHSFRHSFRDALREARVDRELALTLGGWTSAMGGGSIAVADGYGGGYGARSLHDAVAAIDYPNVDLSHLFWE
jgi:integrase